MSKNLVTSADRIAFLLKQANLNFSQTAERTGLSPGTISRATKGRRMTAETVSYLAAHLGTSADWILGNHPDQKREQLLCFRQNCGMHARWAVTRVNQHVDAAYLSCDGCLHHHMSRDHLSTVISIERWAIRAANGSRLVTV